LVFGLLSISTSSLSCDERWGFLYLRLKRVPPSPATSQG
jgi:hypothetical protein